MKTQKTTKTKNYNYYYYGVPIPYSNFLKSVPENWEDEVEDGTFSWGGYSASEREEE